MKTMPASSALVLMLLLATMGQSDENPSVEEIENLIGTWELIAIIEDGIDVTEDYGVTRDGDLVVYEFADDRTFSITAGGDWFESGTWSVDTSVSPMHFDHTPTEAPGDLEIVGEESLGIFEIGRGVVKMCVADEPPDIRPKAFNTDSCTLYIMRARNED